MLAGDGCHARGIGQDVGIDELAFQLLEASQFLFEYFAHGKRSLTHGDAEGTEAAQNDCYGERLTRDAHCRYDSAAGTAGSALLFFLLLQAGVAGGGELVLELLDAAGRVDELQFARVERMADVADIDLQLLPVLRVVNLLPQPQLTTVTKYLGWMPFFMFVRPGVAGATGNTWRRLPIRPGVYGPCFQLWNPK